MWIKQHNLKQQHGKIWQQKATILAVKQNYTYWLLWGKDGGYTTDEPPFSQSTHCWAGLDLKPCYFSSPTTSDTESDSCYKDEKSSKGKEKVVEKEINEEDDLEVVQIISSDPPINSSTPTTPSKQIAKQVKSSARGGMSKQAPCWACKCHWPLLFVCVLSYWSWKCGLVPSLP